MAGLDDLLNQFDRNQLLARANAKQMTGGPVNVPGSSPAYQSAIAEGRPVGSYRAPAAQPFPGLNDYISPQGQPRGYSGMAWSAPTATEVPGLGPQSATPDFMTRYNAPVGPTRPASTVDPIAQKMSAPPQPKGFWDSATMGGQPTAAGTTAADEAATLGKLTGAAGILGRGAAVATSPLTLAAALGGPLAAYVGMKEMHPSYERGHASLLPPSTRPTDQTHGTPYGVAFNKYTQPERGSAPAAPPSGGPDTVRVYRGGSGGGLTTTYDVSPNAPIGKVINVEGMAPGLTPQEHLYNVQALRSAQAANEQQKWATGALRNFLTTPRAVNEKTAGVMNALSAAAGAGDVMAPVRPQIPTRVPMSDVAMGRKLTIEDQHAQMTDQFEARKQELQAVNPRVTPEQLATDPLLRELSTKRAALKARLSALQEATSSKLPGLDYYVGRQFNERGE